MSNLNITGPAGVVPPGRNNDRMVIDWWSTDELWQSGKNPRRYTLKEIKKAERILKRWDVRLPLVISYWRSWSSNQGM